MVVNEMVTPMTGIRIFKPAGEVYQFLQFFKQISSEEVRLLFQNLGEIEKKHSRTCPDVQFKEFLLTKQKTRPRTDYE